MKFQWTFVCGHLSPFVQLIQRKLFRQWVNDFMKHLQCTRIIMMSLTGVSLSYNGTRIRWPLLQWVIRWYCVLITLLLFMINMSSLMKTFIKGDDSNIKIYRFRVEFRLKCIRSWWLNFLIHVIDLSNSKSLRMQV